MKSVLVTGVSGGIGGATARLLAEQGWRVFGIDTDEASAQEALTEFWEGDVSDESLWSDKVIPALENAEVRGLVNNAAIQPCRSILETPLKEWNRTLAVNLGGAFLATRYMAPLLSQQGGAIVNVSSVHALATSPGMAAYVASKGGLLAFTRAAALELAESGIRVNAVLPGATDTKMLEAGIRRSPQNSGDALDELVARTPQHRIGKPSEIAAAIEFLLDSDRSAFITGQSLVVDGGVLASLASE